MLLVPYNGNWKNDFIALSNILFNAISNPSIIIEHVGSTAIPNLMAKPIIDIDIVFNNSVHFEAIKDALEKIGYYHNGNQGTIDREVFKRVKGFSNSNVLDVIAHHLYVCPAHSNEYKRHILLRNYLRKNEMARNEYENIKILSAKEANDDRKKYAAIKEIKSKQFIDAIIFEASKSNLGK